MPELARRTHRGLAIGVVTAFPPSAGTLNEYGAHLVNALSMDSRVTRVHVLADTIDEALPAGTACENSAVSIDRCWTFDTPDAGYRVARAALRADLDAVIFNSHFRSFGQKSSSSALGLLAAPGLRLCGIPTVLILHNLIDTVDLVANGLVKSQAVAALMRFMGTSLTRILLRSSSVSVLLPHYAEILRQNYGRTNILHIPHGTFGVTRSAPRSLPPGPPRILAFGKFGTYKKVDLLLEAAVLLRARRREPVDIVIAGTDSPNTPGYLQSVRERFRDLPGLHFPGYIAEADVESTLASATAIVLPYTTTTGSSGVLHQIGQVGRAVVYPDIDDLAALTRAEGYQGAVFSPGSAQSLADAIAKVLDDEGYRRTLERANLRASSAFTMADVASAYIDEVVRLLPDRPADEPRVAVASDGVSQVRSSRPSSAELRATLPARRAAR